jgi:DNA-binding Lrp family transcriptional regulator
MPVTTYVLIRVDPGSVEEVCAQLRELDEVYEIYEIHERYDILVKVRGRDLDEIRDILIQSIRSIPNVVGSEAFTVYKTWKQDANIKIRN